MDERGSGVACHRVVEAAASFVAAGAPGGLRRAARSLLRAPGFTALAVVLLALGVGAETVTFTLLHRVALRPLPVRDQDRVVVAWSRHRVRDLDHYPFSLPAFEAVRDGVRGLDAVAAVNGWAPSEVLVDDAGGGSSVVRLSRVLGDLFGVLGVKPVFGRALLPADDRPGAARVAVISEGLWARRYGRDPGVLGSSLRGRTTTFTVVGVLPGDFSFPSGTEVWVAMRPFHAGGSETPPYEELELVGRLAPGATAAQVAREIEALYATDPELERAYGETDPVLRPFANVVLGDAGPTLGLLFGAALLVLVAACFNVANLALARAEARRVELGLRRALGAGRLTLLGDALGEAAVLGVAGCAAGAGLSWIGLGAVASWLPADLPRAGGDLAPDAAALALALASTLLVTAVAVAIPALRAARADPADALRGASHGPGRRPARVDLRSALVAGQVAVAVWVGVAGVLLVRTVGNLQDLELGFEPEGLVLVELDQPASYHLPAGSRPAGYRDRLGSVVARLAREPGVVGATPVMSGPLAGIGGWYTIVVREGQTWEEAVDENAFLDWHVVLPSYFDVLEVPIVRGRALSSGDDGSAERAVVVSEAAARLLWPGEKALGRRVGDRFAQGSAEGGAVRWWTVVGVAADTRYGALTEIRPAVYFPLRQVERIAPSWLIVRTARPGAPVLARVREAYAELDPAIRPKSATPLVRLLEAPLARPRLAARIAGLFGAVALLLAAAGVYAVMAVLVRARRREIAVRLACGSTPVGASALVLGRGVRLAAAGALAGALAATLTGRLYGALLFGVEPSDPASLAVGIAAALAAAAAACWVPARRAAGVEPAEALREG